jgi:hypothetical protein
MPPIQLATVLPGGEPFKEDNVNETFRGQVLLADRSVSGAILKDLDPRQLANELLVSVLAQRAGLPTPDTYLALVRGADLPVVHGPSLPDGNRLVFASVDVKVPNITFRARGATAEEQQRLVEEILEWAGLGGLYGFDAWVANVDRHPGNLLFGGKEQVWLIDHGHCLSGPTWAPDDLKEDGDYRNRLTEWLTSRMNLDQKKKRSAEANKLATGLSLIDVDDAAAASHVRALLPPAHVAAATSFLKGRMDKVPRHASKALGVPLML